MAKGKGKWTGSMRVSVSIPIYTFVNTHMCVYICIRMYIHQDRYALAVTHS